MKAFSGHMFYFTGCTLNEDGKFVLPRCVSIPIECGFDIDFSYSPPAELETPPDVEDPGNLISSEAFVNFKGDRVYVDSYETAIFITVPSEMKDMFSQMYNINPKWQVKKRAT